MQTVSHSIQPKQVESHGNNAGCDPFHTAQAGWITWQQCRLWPIPYGPNRLNHIVTMQTVTHSIGPKQAESHGNNADCDPFHTAQAGWITWQQCRLLPIPYGPNSLNHMVTMQTVTHSIRPKQVKSHGNNADCDPFHRAQAGWITWQQCRLWPIPQGPSRLNHMATMQTVTHSIGPKQAESHGNNSDCDPFHRAQTGWITWQQCRLWPIP